MHQNDVPAFEQLQADLIRLMNRHAGHPCRVTAGAIATVIEGLLNHPLIELFPEYRIQCARGLNVWRLRAAPVDRRGDGMPAQLH